MINKALQFFCKIYFTQSFLLDTKNAVWTTQRINIRPNPEMYLPNVRKWWGGGESQRIPLLKSIFLPGGIQFWQSSHTTFEKSENIPLSDGSRECKVFIGKFFCLTCSHVHLESSFDNPVEEFVTKCPWFSAQHMKTIKKIKMLPWARRRQFWQPYEKTFDRRPKTFRSRSEQKKTKAHL